MRTMTIFCDRCGKPIRGGLSVLEIRHGALSARHGDPMDLCSTCGERFGQWLASGRQTVVKPSPLDP